jgi:hypothetical protein
LVDRTRACSILLVSTNAQDLSHWEPALAAVALGAAATQFICPLDDPAHQLVGHVLPVAFLAVFGAIAGRRSLNWLVS